MIHECVCVDCGKKFQSQKTDSKICFDCALENLIGDRAPEEGDFNSARITSGEISDDEARWLQEDLESVDHCAQERFESQFEPYEEDDSWYYPDDSE